MACHTHYAFGMNQTSGFGIVGKSPAIQRLREKIERVGPIDVNVLVIGESGTGKELVVRALHAASRRAARPFVAENCGAIADTLFESTLFGHSRGSFTGASADRHGLFVQANGGTLFLDEIGETPLPHQVKLLRVLQEAELRPVGGSETVKINTRVIAATNRDLREEVVAGRFRADLFYRLNVVSIRTPPLCERLEDLPLLTAHFLERFRHELGHGPEALEPDAEALLAAHPWHGNVRELENVLKQAYVMATGSVIRTADLIGFARGTSPRGYPTVASIGTQALIPPIERMSEVRTNLIRTAMLRAGGRVAVAAKELGIPLRTLYHQLDRLGLADLRRRS
jgi:two-component system response regulator HydG